MKKTCIYIFLAALSLLTITSCSDDDNNDVPNTNVKGKPSVLSFYDYFDGGSNSNISYLYNKENTIRRTISNSSYSDFTYKDGVLTFINSGQLDSNVADGHSSIKFDKDENKITIDAWGEPSSIIYRYEIVLDDNNIPTKLNELGNFRHNEKGDLVQETDGYYYSIFTYDASGKKLMKQSIYIKQDSRFIYEIDYGYDNNPGLFSKVDLPTWYIAYKAFESKSNIMLSSNIYLSNINNLLSKKTKVKETNTDLIVNYTLKYDTDNYPISISGDVADEGDFLNIRY